MKVNGVDATKVSAWEPPPLVLDRGADENGEPVFLVFRARGVKSMQDFDNRVPFPTNESGAFDSQGRFVPNPEAAAYLDKLRTYHDTRWAYICIKTLEPSNIEWDTVKDDDPNTWVNWEKDLDSILVSEFEFSAVERLIRQANALDEGKMEENRQTFFQMLGAVVSTNTGLQDEAENSPSGEPVNAGA